MSLSATVQYWVMVVTLLVFHECAEAAFPDELDDRSRVLLTYDLSTDKCRNISTDSDDETKLAANKACAQAFEALHRFGVNSCKGWRQPECRLLGKVPHPQCSCLISSIDDSDIHSDKATTFRYCAWKLVSDGTFRGNQDIHDDPVQKAELKRKASAEASASRLSKPRRKASKTSPHVCEICRKIYATARSLTAHKNTHIKEPICETCGRPFSNKQNLTAHKKKEHPEIYKAEKEEEELLQLIEKHFQCEICKTRFTTQSMLNRHLPVHRGETTCDLCNKTFRRKTFLNQHKKTDHA